MRTSSMSELRSICKRKAKPHERSAWIASNNWDRLGAPTARPRSIPSLSRKRVVGVERISNFRTNSRCDSASISRWRTPGISAITSVISVRVIRHGVQKADENCTKVASLPNSSPRRLESIAPSFARAEFFTFPREDRYQIPYALVSARMSRIGARLSMTGNLTHLWHAYSC